MDATTLVRRGSRVTLLFLSTSLAFACVLGCDEPAAQADPQATPAEKPSKEAPPTANTEAASGKPSFKEQAFELRLEAPSEVKVGAPAEFKLILLAQSGYKVNDEYPLKFQFAETPGVSPQKKIVRKEDAKLEKQRAELPLSVTIEKAGKHQVSGKFSFSVCTEERCLIEKRDLRVDVTAS